MRNAARWVLRFAVAVAALPAILLVPYYVTHRGSYPAWSDHALMTLQVRAIWHHPVLVGVFSREGWHHPGPALYYLLDGPYLLLGRSNVALPVVALLVNAASVAAVAALIRRRLGIVTALWTLIVLGIYLRFAEPGFWRDAWNPTLPILPFAVMVLLCVALVERDLVRLAPVAVGLGSFCMQCHLGFVVPVIAVLALTGGALLWRPLRSDARSLPRAIWRRRGVLAAGVAVVVVMWLPPFIQQVTGHPGNIGQILAYLRANHPTSSLADSGRVMATQLGALPAYVTGRVPVAAGLATAPQLPWWTGVVGVLAFVAAVGAAARMRHGGLLRLAGFTAVVMAAGAIAVDRIVGPIFAYIVAWTAVAGILLWTTVGATVIVAVGRRLDSASRPVPRGLVAAGCAGALVALAVPSAFTVRDTLRVTPGTSSQAPRLAALVLAWLGPDHRGDTVRIDPAAAGGSGGLVDLSLLVTPGVVLELRRQGVEALVPPAFETAYGSFLVDRGNRARWQVTVGGLVPPNGAGRMLGRVGTVAVYGVAVDGASAQGTTSPIS